MKSFFKKLSLVLAAAMIITLIPAQAAKAADAKVITYAKQKESKAVEGAFELKVGASEDFKFLGCPDYKTTGSKVNGGWTSSNEAVATVNNKGVVTAVAAGTTEIAYNATGYTGSLFVVVPADSYAVYLADQTTKEKVTAKTLTKVGEQYDLCFIGATGYKSSKFAASWDSSNKAVATVDRNGLVTAVAAGEATIYLTITEKASGKVASNWAVEPCKVTVDIKKAAEVVLTQTGYNTATVTVDGKALASLEGAMFYVLDEKNEPQEMYTVIVKDDKKGIFQFNGLGIENGKTYFVTVGENKSNEVVGKVGALDSFTVTYKSKAVDGGEELENYAFVNQPTKIEVGSYVDKEGKTVVLPENTQIEILDTYTSNGTEVAKDMPVDSTIYVLENEVHTITVTLKNIEGKAICAPVTKVIKPSTIPALDFTSVTFKIGTLDAEYKDCNETSAPKGLLSLTNTGSVGLAVEIKDSRGVKQEFKAGKVNADDVASWDGRFTFKSSTPSVLDVADNGTLIAITADKTANVALYYNYVDTTSNKTVSKFLGSTNLTVQGDLYAANYSLDGCVTTMNSTTTGNSLARISDDAGADKYNEVTFKFTVKDQNGNALAFDPAKDVKVTDTKGNALTVFKKLNEKGEKVDGIEVAIGDNNAATLKLTADDITDSKTASQITNLLVKVSVGGKSVSIPYTVYVYNYDSVSDIEAEPYIYLSKKAENLGNIGNDATAAVTAEVKLVDVKRIAGIPVYGNAVSSVKVFDYATIKSIANDTTKLTAWANGTSEAYFVEIADSEGYTVNNAVTTITVRKSYEDLTSENATNATSEITFADTLAGLADKTVKIKVYRLLGNDTAKTVRECVTYINAAKGNNSFTVKNNDSSKIKAKLDPASGYDYSITRPSNNEAWKTEFAKILKLTTNGKDYNTVSEATMINFQVFNSSKGFVDGMGYVQYVTFYIKDTNGNYVKVKADINKKFTFK